jgi:HEAT repeat protein
MKRWLPLVLLFLLGLLGCSKPPQPPTTGGHSVDHWVQALRGPDPKVRQEAARKLGNAGPLEDTVYPALANALQDQEPAVRCEAILALLKLGPLAREALPRLAELQRKDRNARERT